MIRCDLFKSLRRYEILDRKVIAQRKRELVCVASNDDFSSILNKHEHFDFFAF